MQIYIDINNNYKCYSTNSDNILLPYETNFFDDKCDTFIEGYQCIPIGYEWIRDDGEIFIGEMIAPLVDYIELEKAQLKYENEQLKIQNSEYESALTEIEQALGV